MVCTAYADSLNQVRWCNAILVLSDIIMNVFLSLGTKLVKLAMVLNQIIVTAILLKTKFVLRII